MIPRKIQLGIAPCDGIGPEIAAATVKMVSAALARNSDSEIAWNYVDIGWESIRATGQVVSEEAIEVLRSCVGWVMGPHDSASYPREFAAQMNPSAALRRHFNLYANLRPARPFPGTRTVAERCDLMIVRENSEGFYVDRIGHQGSAEFMPTRDVVLSTGLFTRAASQRIAHFAFRIAASRRSKVTVTHKANVVQMGHGLFRDVVREVSNEYSNVVLEEEFADATAALLIRNPSQYDVLLAPNLVGDILSDLTAELTGGLGLAPSLNVGDEVAMAQAVHGSAPEIAGTNTANPVGLTLSGAMLLDWLATRYRDQSLRDTSSTIVTAIETALTGGVQTQDIGGVHSTTQFADEIVDIIAES